MLACLTVLGDTGFELTSTRGDDEDSTIGLRGTSNHVLDKVAVTGSINDLGRPSVFFWLSESGGSGDLVGSIDGGDTHSDHVLGSFELPKSNIDGDTTFTLGL